MDYLFIAQSEDDDRQSEQIQKLFASQFDLKNVNVIIEKYENIYS